VTREVARRLIDEKREEEKRKEHWARQQEQLTANVVEAQAGVRRGVPAPQGLEHLSAAQLLGAGAKAERLDAAGRRYEEYASGDITYHPLPQKEEE
jgi:hypothetical protein